MKNMNIEEALNSFSAKTISKMEDFSIKVKEDYIIKVRTSYPNLATPIRAHVIYGHGEGSSFNSTNSTLFAHLFCQFNCVFTSFNWWSGDGISPAGKTRSDPNIMTAVINQHLIQFKKDLPLKIWLVGNSVGSHSAGLCAQSFHQEFNEDKARLERVFLFASPKIIGGDIIDKVSDSINLINKLDKSGVKTSLIYGDQCIFYKSLRFDKHVEPHGNLRAKVIVLPGRGHSFFTEGSRDYEDKYQILASAVQKILSN